jgi:hypothetical protein
MACFLKSLWHRFPVKTSGKTARNRRLSWIQGGFYAGKFEVVCIGL